MRHSICKLIRIFASIMLVGGILMCLIAKYQAWEAGIGYYSRDSSAVVMWNIIFVQSIITAISSVFVFGFAYIVEAACKYLDRCEREEMAASTENEE